METIASIANMPLKNIVAFGIVAIALVLLGLAIIKTLRKHGLAAVGPVKFEEKIKETQREVYAENQAKEHEGQSNQHFMDEEIRDADEICKNKCRIITSKMKNVLVHNLRDYKVCLLGRRAIASALRFPLYEAIANNHFTRVLMPGRITEYRAVILCDVEQEYLQIYDDYTDNPCPDVTVPTWQEVKPMAIRAVDNWLKSIAGKVGETCQEKIRVYEKYRPMFESAGDKYRIGIADTCIEKNRAYMRELERLALM